MTTKINKNGVNTSNSKNKKSNSSTNANNNRDVTIYHQSGKEVLRFMGMLTIAMALMFGFCLYSMSQTSQRIDDLDGKVAGILLGLSSE